jgi:SagB-type dehydrogenase family enzyme
MARRTDTDVARLYHLHSSHERVRPFEPNPDPYRPEIRFRTCPGAARVDLPGRDFAVPMGLGEALDRRRSLREYRLRPLPLETLGRVLHTTYGVRGHRQVDGEWFQDRSAPSAGGKYPLEMYLAAQSVEGIGDGLYHYDASAHALEHLRPGLFQPTLAELTMGQEMVRDTNVVIVVTAIRERTMGKYGQRGYRYVWIDAGHLGQSFYLVATALGLGPVAIGGFLDAEVNALLDLPAGEEAVYILCLGQPAEAGAPR